MNSQSIPAVKKIIRALNAEDAKHFINDVLKETSETGVLELVFQTYGSTLFEIGYTES
jgi:phosphoenolpyruvate-protein kinase (PTS system EI component)